MPWKNHYKLVIFDCDGTLVDSERISNSLIADMMNELGIAMSEAKSLELFNGTHFGRIREYVETQLNRKLDFDFENQYRERCRELFEKELKEVKGASAFIQRLPVQICVASNGPHVKMASTLKVTGLVDLIGKENIFSAYDIGKFKPAPDLFLHAASHYDTKPENTLVIEDTIPGIEAALSAKMDVWGIFHKGINDEILQYNIPIYEDYTEIKI